MYKTHTNKALIDLASDLKLTLYDLYFLCDKLLLVVPDDKALNNLVINTDMKLKHVKERYFS